MTPDTVISLTNGQKFVVLETSDEVIRKVIEFRREISRGPSRAPGGLMTIMADQNKSRRSRAEASWILPPSPAW